MLLKGDNIVSDLGLQLLIYKKIFILMGIIIDFYKIIILDVFEFKIHIAFYLNLRTKSNMYMYVVVICSIKTQDSNGYVCIGQLLK